MKVTKEKATENRAALLRAASRLFQERGIDGVGVAEISKKAGVRRSVRQRDYLKFSQ
jgi:TetR/AcrR family transcriptional repressor of nem operon